MIVTVVEGTVDSKLPTAVDVPQALVMAQLTVNGSPLAVGAVTVTLVELLVGVVVKLPADRDQV